MMVFYFATSSIVGIDDDDPLRVTVIDEAREANFKVSSISNPRTSPEIKYPIKYRQLPLWQLLPPYMLVTQSLPPDKYIKHLYSLALIRYVYLDN